MMWAPTTNMLHATAHTILTIKILNLKILIIYFFILKRV